MNEWAKTYAWSIKKKPSSQRRERERELFIYEGNGIGKRQYNTGFFYIQIEIVGGGEGGAEII